MRLSHGFVVTAGCVIVAACTILTDLDGLSRGSEGAEDGVPDAFVPDATPSDADGGSTPVTCASPGFQAGAPWPTLGGCAARTGRSAYVGTGTPEKKWSLGTSNTPYGLYVAGVLIDRDDNLYLGDNEGLTSVTRDGVLRWRNLIGDVTYNGAISADGTVLVATGDGGNRLNALFPDGGIRWQIATQQDDLVPNIADDGTIFFAAERTRAYAVEPSGALRQFIRTDAGAYRSAIGNGLVYFTTRDNGFVHAMHPDGGLVWTAFVPNAADVSVGSNGVVYVATANSRLFAVSDGIIRWMFEPPGGAIFGDHGTPTIDTDGTIYYGAHDGVRALSPGGAQLWHFPLAARAGGVTLDAEGNLFFCAGETGQVTEVISLRRDGSLRWRFPVQASCTISQPAIGRDGTIYVGLRERSTLLAIGP